MRKRVTCLAVVAGMLAFGAAPAAATTYCVALPGTCDAANNRASLEAALSDAAAQSGADRVLLGEGTFTAAFTSGFDYSAADPVEIIGRGPATILTAAGSLPAGEAVLSLSGHLDSAVRDLAVSIPAISGAADGIVLTGTTASGVSVNGATTTQVRRGIVQTGGRVESSDVVAPGTSTASTAVLNTDGTVDNVTVGGAGYGLTLVGTTTTKRLHAIGSAVGGVYSTGVGTHTISQSEIRNTGTYGMHLVGNTSTSQTITITDTTLSATGVYGLYSTASGTVTLRGTNIVNSSYGVYRGGAASFSVTYSNVWNNSSGNFVSVTAGTGTISQNPQFVSTTDLRLRPTSPLIDAGDPASAAAPVDAGGRTRDMDGNGDATVRRDMGAHEYQRAAPIVTASVAPAQPAPGQEVTFSSTASDPDGDDVVIGWTFSDGTVASTSTVKKTFTAPGTYTGTFMVTDSSGRSSSAQASVTIPAPPAEEKPADPPAGTGDKDTPPSLTPAAPAADTLAPVLSALSLPKSVRLGKSAPAPAPTGTLRFRLSEAASVKFSFALARVRGGKTKFIRVPGAFTVAGKAGLNRIRFAGRTSRTKALKPGRYRITLTPRDAAGNPGKAVTRTFVLRPA